MFYRCYNNVLPYIGDAMSDLRKAAERYVRPGTIVSVDVETTSILVDLLRQALAQPEQEPVGYVTIETISSWAKVPSIKWFKKPTEGPLYTAPPKREWVGLTDEEIDVAVKSCNTVDTYKYFRAIEAKLKEKNA